MKKVIYIIMTILGLVGFLSLYVIVCLVQEEEFAGLKYVIMIIGYLSVILFGGGFLMLLTKKKEVNEDAKR
ncbi:MAG TPA: hypothetical protein DCR62_06970 [Acholeplasmatales bacterium]|jgi:hypothetical protein|nr:hypothetical protein [Bacilli bacterium]MBS6563182.1 hypothetical protein [Staphylococcus sp.]CDC68913.1 unknown [Staphylococcus sp. CAG:324]HAR58471.1 hypothetical protein [Acholeplasmatales bacterium]